MSESVVAVFTIPTITWSLTVILLLSGSYHFIQAARSHQLTDRINKSLHALMNMLMAAMLWNLAPSTTLAQITVLAGATLWFIIQAVARPEFKTLCAGRQGRLKCVYHGLTMAGAAFMVAMMGHAATASHEILPAAATPVPSSASHAHHTMAPAAQGPAVTGMAHSSDQAILLTAFFGAAAVVFIVLLVRGRIAETTRGNQVTPRHSASAEHAHEALGAAIMALMFATMTA